MKEGDRKKGRRNKIENKLRKDERDIAKAGRKEGRKKKIRPK
jgi:hypothetical protein